MEHVVPIVALMIAVAVAVRIIAGVLDHGRIRREVEGRGGRVDEVRWTPFGRGWFGSQNERIYRVRFRDGEGVERAATVKTSALAGVYFTDEDVVRPPGPAAADQAAEREAPSRAELEAENRRLRDELDRLRHGQE
jgi:hypothetical protein